MNFHSDDNDDNDDTPVPERGYRALTLPSTLTLTFQPPLWHPIVTGGCCQLKVRRQTLYVSSVAI